MKTEWNVIHTERWKPQYLQTSCNVVGNMTNTINNFKGNCKWLIVTCSYKYNGFNLANFY